jgi:hypothetical protein
MLHVVGVALTFRAACAAHLRARLELGTQDRDVWLCLPQKQPARGIADVSAVEVESDAADELLDVRLAETGVGAAGTGHSTVEAGLYALQQGIPIDRTGLRVALQHRFKVTHATLLPRGVCGAGTPPLGPLDGKSPIKQRRSLLSVP